MIRMAGWIKMIVIYQFLVIGDYVISKKNMAGRQPTTPLTTPAEIRVS